MKWIAIGLALTLPVQAVEFDWPTANRALAEGRPEDFYMYVDRNFEGVATKPWEGGTFGYVRGPQRLGGDVVFTSLHEGIDIAPVRRDGAGNPLDEVFASADGVVVHTSHEAGASNYGRYVVLEHRIEDSPVHTLYAHLAKVSVTPGQKVSQGEALGTMGFTGAGLNRERSHLHFEICLRLSRDFENWYARHYPGSSNKHGIYHGFNLVGFEPASVLLASSTSQDFRISTHLRSLPAAYEVTFPATANLNILRDYPWLVPDGEPAAPEAWTISFTEHGVPVKAVAAPAAPAEPKLEWVRETPYAYHAATRGIVTGPQGSPRLSDSGRRFLELMGPVSR